MEHYNGIILVGLLHMAATIPGAPLHEILPNVLAGPHFLPRRVGYQPYLVVFKQHPNCLGIELAFQGVDKAVDLQENVAK